MFFDPFVAIAAAIATGIVLGTAVGAIVVYAGLSSLIATLGMNYMLRGLIMIVTEGKSIALLGLRDTTAYQIFSSSVAFTALISCACPAQAHIKQHINVSLRFMHFPFRTLYFELCTSFIPVLLPLLHQRLISDGIQSGLVVMSCQ